MNHHISRVAFRFLMGKKHANKSFHLEELREATGWAHSTILTYYSKKWRSHVQRSGDTFTVVGFNNFTEDDFIALQTQNAA